VGRVFLCPSRGGVRRTPGSMIVRAVL
jgi:hypothetical protein